MIVATLVRDSHGFNVHKDGSRSKWAISIGSTVAIDKRHTRNAYYILITESGVVGASASMTGDNVEIKLKKDNYKVPAYVRDMAIDILENGNLNKYVEGESIDNDFTKMKSAKEYS